MNFQWILLALFLVAIISGMSKALSKSMLKNTLRLGSVVLAFLVTFILQLCGVFQGIVNTIAETLDVAAMLPGFEGALGLILGIASTLVSPILFTIVFFVLLWIFRIIIHFVVKSIEKKQANKTNTEQVAQPSTEEAAEPVAIENAETVEAHEPAPAEEATVMPEVKADMKAEELQEKPKKKKKSAFYKECAWRRAISIASGALCGILVLAISLMPIFYLMSVVTTATDALEDSDATDSQIYNIIEVVDENIATPYKSSFVAGFYDVLGLSDLMNYTARIGGKINVDGGETVYADDVLKNVLTNGLRTYAQITSAESNCSTVQNDIKAIVSDPMLASIVSDLLMNAMKDMEITPPEEGDIMGEITNTFLEHYKNADKDTISKDLQSVGGALGILAEEGIVLQLIAGNTEFEALLENEEMLRGVVKAISELSAFGPTIEGAFGTGIDILGSSLGIPANSEEAYGAFIEHLIDATNGEASSVRFTYSEVQSFVRYCVSNGKKYNNNRNHSGYDDFEAYLARWKAIQLAFGHSGEDRSFGDFTIELDGKLYILKSKRFVEVPAAPGAGASQSELDKYYKEYTKRISPVADLIHYIAKNAGTRATDTSLKNTVNNYLSGSSISEAGRDTAQMIVNADYSKLDAVTVEKMLSSTDFDAWTEETMAQDSEKCVDIIFNLLGMMDMLGGSGEAQDMTALAGQLAVVGETMDIMRETTCIKDLAPVLLEGLMSNEMFSMIPIYTAYSYNEAVVTGALNSHGEPTTYTDIMNELLGMLENLGGVIQ